MLSRRRKNNPVLLGEPGVGKTAIIEGLATRIVDGEVPPSLMHNRILALDLSLVVAGTKVPRPVRGTAQGHHHRTDHRRRRDHLHRRDPLVDRRRFAEGSLDAANILKPTLSRGEVQCIGATTPTRLPQVHREGPRTGRRFQPINIKPPTESETFEILTGVKERYERFHGVRFDDEAIRAAVYQSNRYITDRFLAGQGDRRAR